MSDALPKIKYRFERAENSDLFYEVTTFAYDIRTPEDERVYQISHPQLPQGAKCLWAEVVGWKHSIEKSFRCSVQPPHPIQTVYSEFELEFFGWTEMAEFIRESTWGEFVISEPFKERLKRTTLRGYGFVPFKVSENQSKIKDPKVHILQFIGRNCERPLVVVGRDNTCPYCNSGYVVCPECGWKPDTCIKCSREMSTVDTYHQGRTDKRLILDLNYRDGRVLDISKWDGSDLIRSHSSRFVTKRVWDWIVSIHAGPLMSRPVKICFDGMSDKQRKWCAEAADIRTVE